MSSLAPLEALAKQRLSDLWESTLALLEQGKQEDERGNSAAAYLQYSEAIGGLQALLEQEADARRQELLRARLVEYSLRLQQLNALRQEAQEAAAPAFPSAPSQAPPVQQQLSGGLTSGGLTIQASSAASPAAKPLASARLATEQAVQADEAGDGTEALELYTIAIEAFFEAIKLEPAAEHRTLMAGLLDRAEQLKLSAAATGAVAATRPITAPTAAAAAPAAPAAASPPAAARPAAPPAGQGYTEEEKAVLTRSSTINGRRYYPWLDDAARERFSYAAAWSDPDGLLALNAEQRSHFGRWARPSEVMRGEPKMIYLVSSLTITQTIITDCSFVSSLVIAAAYERKFRKQLITKILYPQDRRGVPIYNPAGKYLVKLTFNGVARKIVVDDRLPVSRGGDLMCSHSTHREELWVSIIEKAYLKVMGGYDFPGGNSGIDMFALTGWIPEQFRTDGADFNPQRLWERMVSATKYGDCLITVATGDMTDAEGERLGLVPTHAYAVLQVREVGGVRLLQLKNPWARIRWKGSYSAHDTQRWTAALREELQYEPTQALQMDNGIFWIDYGNMLKHYKGVYSNWNPALFRHHSSTHGQWPKRAAANANDSKNIGANPQYGLRLSVSAEQVGAGRSAAVWLLLSRHAQRGASATHGEEGKDDYLTVHVFKARGGHRVYYLETCWRQGVYSNTPHCLVKFELEPGDHSLTLALAQFQPVHHQVDYTLDVYSMVPFRLRPLPFRMRHTEMLAGAWRGVSAGGCPNYDTYVDNPRFRLSAGGEVDLLVELEAAKGHDTVAVALHLVPEEGGGEAKQLKLSSGDYRGGFCMLEARSLPAGHYTLTASTFDHGKELGFELSVSCGSSAAVGVTSLPHEAAGLKRLVVKGGALVPRATLEAGVYMCVPSTFDKWDGAFELMVCAPEGALRVELLPG